MPIQNEANGNFGGFFCLHIFLNLTDLLFRYYGFCFCFYELSVCECVYLSGYVHFLCFYFSSFLLFDIFSYSALFAFLSYFYSYYFRCLLYSNKNEKKKGMWIFLGWWGTLRILEEVGRENHNILYEKYTYNKKEIKHFRGTFLVNLLSP